MIEPFCSVYTKDYRSYDKESEVERAKPCFYQNDAEENFLPLEYSKWVYNAEKHDALIKEKDIKSLQSTYQVSYCCNIFKKSLVIHPENLDDDQFIAHFNQYYSKRTQPVLRPPETSRRINGYMRFENFYTRKTELEETINRLAYEYFKRDYDRGKSRLFGKMQKQLNPESKETKEEKVAEGEIEAEIKPKENQVQEKICGLCCEKFGDFSYPKEN